MPKVLQPLQRVTAGDMSDDITSGVVDGRYLTNIKWQLVWTGAPVGSFSIEESLNYNPVTQVGDWYDNGSGISDAAGVDGSAIINLSNRPPCFYRVTYAFSSGTGVLNVWASGSGPL